MHRFPLTKKKLLQQPPARRHKLVAHWLRQIYLDMQENAFATSFSDFIRNYKMILQWLGESTSTIAQITEKNSWIECVADSYHHHQKLSGKGLAEHNLLPKVKIGDGANGLPWKPVISYKVALDNIRSAFNVGSVFRLADATGFEAVMVGGMTPGIENQQVNKTSMGCADWIPQERYDDLPGGLLQQKRSGYRAIGIETVEESRNHLDYCWPEKGIIILGNEEYGISQEVLQVCDAFVHLPMQGKKNSVNVANAFAVVAFQIAFNRSEP